MRGVESQDEGLWCLDEAAWMLWYSKFLWNMVLGSLHPWHGHSPATAALLPLFSPCWLQSVCQEFWAIHHPSLPWDFTIFFQVYVAAFDFIFWAKASFCSEICAVCNPTGTLTCSQGWRVPVLPWDNAMLPLFCAGKPSSGSLTYSLPLLPFFLFKIKYF